MSSMITRHSSSRPTIWPISGVAVSTRSCGVVFAFLTTGDVTRRSRKKKNIAEARATERSGMRNPTSAPHAALYVPQRLLRLATGPAPKSMTIKDPTTTTTRTIAPR